MSAEKPEKLTVWLLREGEPLPVDEHPRLMRTGLLAEWLRKQGHEVIWWCSAFEHQSKTYRVRQTETVEIAPGEKLVMLYTGIRYRKNVSPLRLL